MFRIESEARLWFCISTYLVVQPQILVLVVTHPCRIPSIYRFDIVGMITTGDTEL